MSQSIIYHKVPVTPTLTLPQTRSLTTVQPGQEQALILSHHCEAVSYTHMTLPTNREV